MHNGLPVRFGKPTRRKSKFPIIMVIIIILALLTGIYFVHGTFFNKNTKEIQEPVNTQLPPPVKNVEPSHQQVVVPAESEPEAEDDIESLEEPKDSENDITEEEISAEENIDTTPADDEITEVPSFEVEQ